MTVHHAKGERQFPDVVDALEWVRTLAPSGDVAVVRDSDGVVMSRRGKGAPVPVPDDSAFPIDGGK